VSIISLNYRKKNIFSERFEEKREV